MSPITIEKEYLAHLDSKKRAVIRNASHSVYKVREYPDGHLVFIPCDITPSPKLKKETLAQIERSIENLKKQRIGKAVDVKAALNLYHK